ASTGRASGNIADASERRQPDTQVAVEPQFAVSAHGLLLHSLPYPLCLGDHPVLVGVRAGNDGTHVSGLRMVALPVPEPIQVAARGIGSVPQHDDVGGAPLDARRDGPPLRPGPDAGDLEEELRDDPFARTAAARIGVHQTLGEISTTMSS